MAQLTGELVPNEGDHHRTHDTRSRNGPPARASPSTASGRSQQVVSTSTTSAGRPRANSPNIVLFGETGIGKSSLINMLASDDVARTSGDALGCTFESQGYPIEIDGQSCTVWDTAGLNEGEHGSVPADQGMRYLQDLVWKLEGGVSLLVYCVRGTRFRDILQINYDLFHNIIFQRKVPLVLVVTGLEHEERMESWWDENHYEFEARRMQVVDHACVAATKGKRMASGEHMFEEEYADSAVKLRQLIAKNVQHAPWFPSPGWMAQITEDLADYYEGAKEKSATQTRDMHPEDYRSGNRLLDFLQWLLQLGPRFMQPTRRYTEHVDGGTHGNQRG